MSIFKQFAGQTIIYGLGHVLGKVLNFVLIASYITRKLQHQEAEYGIYNEMYFYVALLLILLGLRMETTFFRFGNQQDQRGSAYTLGVTTMLLTGGGWLLIGLFFGENMMTWLGYPGRGLYIQLLSGLLAIDLLVAMPLARMRLEGQPGKFVRFQLGSILLNIFFILFFLELCPLLEWEFLYRTDVLLAAFLANFIARVIILILLSGEWTKITFDLDFGLWKKMLSYAWPLVLVGLAGVFNQSSYIVLQKYFLSGNVLQNMSTGGVYAAATKIALLMSIFVTAYNFAAEPFFFNQTRRGDAPYIYAQMARAFAWVAALLFLIITLFIDLFQYIVDASYRGLMDVVPILLLGYILLGLYYNVAVWYKVSDHTRHGALISLVGSVVTFGVNLWLLPKIGVFASAWASLMCYAAMLVVSLKLGQKRYPVPYEWTRIFLPLLVAMLLGYVHHFLAMYLQGPSIWMVRTGLLILFMVWAFFIEKNKWKEWARYR